jgi:hypothetical protein
MIVMDLIAVVHGWRFVQVLKGFLARIFIPGTKPAAAVREVPYNRSKLRPDLI